MEMKIVTMKDFDNICRGCLQREDLQDLFNLNLEDVPLVNLFRNVTKIEVEEDDELPRNLCSKCVSLLVQIHIFIKHCQENDRLLKTLKRFNLEDEISSKNDTTEFERDLLKSASSETEDTPDDNCNIEDSYINGIIGQDLIKNEHIVLQVVRESENEIEEKKTEQHSCKVCENSYESKGQLKEHYKKSRLCRPREHSCEICIKAFYNKHKLVEHMRSHTKEMPYECEVCSKRFRFPQNLTRHKKSHSGEKPYPCSICNKAFTRAMSRDEHMNDHTGETPFICDYCGRRFKRSSSHYLHIARHKIKNGDIKKEANLEGKECLHCNKRFSSKWTLKTHILTHTGEKKFLCNHCGKDFTTKGGLQSHAKVHTGDRPFSCPTCNKKFSQQCGLKNHVLIHSGVKPHVCHLCSKSFVQSSHLKLHMRTHSGERPYGCSFCGKTFALNSNLKVHTRIHTGETPYVCSVCDTGFYDSSSLKKHKKTHGT